jgi:hypothetical protein
MPLIDLISFHRIPYGPRKTMAFSAKRECFATCEMDFACYYCKENKYGGGTKITKLYTPTA